MREHIATLMSDYYKQAHAEQYSKRLVKLVDYLTPRDSRLAFIKYLISWGHQGFCKEFLIEYFNKNFFERPLEEVMAEQKRVIKHTLRNDDSIDFSKIEALHKLGYLPIEIKIIPEGTIVPIKVPMVEISNTHPDFVWVVGFIESVMSCEMWYPMTVANQAYGYRQIVNKFYDETVENGAELAKHAISEFGFRGGKGREAGILASAAFLTSFDKTATIPAILYLEDYYNCNIEDGNVAGGMISTEHSVMCSNTSIDGNEETFYHKLFTELYPTGAVSVVCDSYDYWNIVTNVICDSVKSVVLNRDGTVYVRGDSGKPADILCGTLKATDYIVVDGLTVDGIEQYCKKKAQDEYDYEDDETKYNNRIGDYLYRVTCTHGTEYDEDYEDYMPSCDVEMVHIEKIQITPEMKGTVECLYDGFGGYVNSLGYKVLDNHVRAIYGDSITPVLAKEIYQRLKDKGFAANNVALGAGSFSMQCTMELNELKPFTRDTYGIAIKATYGELDDGTKIEIFKNPKTDTDRIKKSQRGMCVVYRGEDGVITYEDGYNSEDIPSNNMFETIFKDGKMVKEVSIHEVRNRLHNNQF